ncbi:hypothetical protein E2C01_085719 [Portunus trituberculatus]|uniref:Uncharacterized protein n=1 Tax=Portunus trituberculatus TaxID=210409 RepID=A0A5B7J3H5_PORTR|nr:hypothetical protein [Portunus trituberculatus]
MLAEQRVAQTKWLKGTLTLHSDRFRKRSDFSGELLGSPCGHQGTIKFEFKLPSVHSDVHGYPTTKGEFRQAEICQVRRLTVVRNIEDCRELQKDINKIWEWSQEWKLEFSTGNPCLTKELRSLKTLR